MHIPKCVAFSFQHHSFKNVVFNCNCEIKYASWKSSYVRQYMVAWCGNECYPTVNAWRGRAQEYGKKKVVAFSACEAASVVHLEG